MRILLLLVMVIIGAPVLAQTPDDPMRGLVWGLPQETVKAFERAVFVGEEEGVLVYSTSIRPDPAEHSYDVMIEYRFDAQGLVRILYDRPTNIANSREALDDAMIWQRWLDVSFGQASKPRFNFNNPRIYADPLRWGGAIYRGQGNLNIDWASEETRARLSLTARNSNPRLIVMLSPIHSRMNP